MPKEHRQEFGCCGLSFEPDSHLLVSEKAACLAAHLQAHLWRDACIPITMYGQRTLTASVGDASVQALRIKPESGLLASERGLCLAVEALCCPRSSWCLCNRWLEMMLCRPDGCNLLASERLVCLAALLNANRLDCASLCLFGLSVDKQIQDCQQQVVLCRHCGCSLRVAFWLQSGLFAWRRS